ncbi:hypothetical protein OG875_12260 [Streptomyces sp. NBC_01498]|uniref:hypothetical protein n=1 Tax=Streptomyces sp. NBC_01498 TaxID=2975870 RepID=UPI002E7C22CC|nr:hypothetical protein [Streptomyces sp. NBC_01498]WTL25291.1 hypothetical protein OG875_12260 [Streptomyces sp. NBC_01498]
MPGVLTTDHPAWTETSVGAHARATRTASGVWVLSWDQEGPHTVCVQGAEDAKPVFITTDPRCLPGSVPPELRRGLDDLGPTWRPANPWLWDALTTAILRQVVRAGQARKLYRAWCDAFGTTVEGPAGTLSVAPTATRVLELDDTQFAHVGAKFHCGVLRAAAAAYQRHRTEWERMDSHDLVSALTSVPRIGPWTAAAATADYTGDFSVYPHDDLAVRTWAARIAPGHDWPGKKDKSFGPKWAAMAGPDRTALHTLTLSTLTWGSHAR